ncbi:MAG: ABC transporter substrate-binding protein [Treponema sp.]|jgi:putative aldouronate transport system substrate-binding protein|nr:ABC transporter substrate-binding protein [Treponema sp.]
MKKLLLTGLLLFGSLALVFGGGQRSGGARGATTAGTKTPITFTLFNADATEDLPFSDPVAKKINELTGVSLEVDRPVGGDTQAVALMIASGQYPDLIYAKGDLTKLIESGAVIPLDDLIEKRGANFKKLYGDQIVRLRNSTADPKIYHAGTYGVNTAHWATDGSLQLQHAILKDQGYPPMKTLADYEKAIKAYMAKYPTINGQKTIGLSLLIDTWQWFIDLANPANYLIGWPDDGQWLVDQRTNQATYKFLNPEMKIYYQWLNRMHAEGILDPESFTQKEDVWKAKIASGRVLGIGYPLWGYGDARTSLIRDGMPERTYAYMPIVADSHYESALLKDYGFGGGWGIAISSTCKDPERAFEFIDWICSEEAQILVNWGLPGVNYTVQNGKRVQTASDRSLEDIDPDYQKKTGVGRWAYPFPQLGQGFIDSTGNYITKDSPENIKANYIPVERETLAAYGAQMWTDLYPSPEKLGISKHGQAWQYALPPDVNALVTEADDLSKSALANMILGRPADFDAAWNKFQADLKSIGIEQANQALTELVKDKLKLWGVQ